MDLLDTVKKTLEAAGLGYVALTLADGRKHDESVTLTVGMPQRRTVDYAGTEEESFRVTAIVKRLTDPKASADATTAERALHFADFTVNDGWESLKEVRTEPPRPLPWNESGRYVWAFDTIFTFVRKDFF